MLTLLKRLPIQNTSPSFLVSFVRETTLLITSIAEVRRVWFHGHPIFEHPEVFQQPSSLSRVGTSHPAFGGHAGGKILASVGHAKSKQSSIASHVDTIEKTGRSKCKLKFPCKLCEGDHLTHQCLAIIEVQRVWPKTQEFPSLE